MLHPFASSGQQETAGDRFWAVPAEALLARLGATPDGLSGTEAARRLAARGRNAVGDGAPPAIAAKVLRRLAEPMVAILITAAVVSGLTGDWPGFGIVLGIVAASVAMDVVREHRAEQSAAALRDSVAVRAKVRRDGRWETVPVETPVPGDVVELAAGAPVPADGLLLEGEGAQANEALLTGEPYPVAKRPGVSGGATPAEAGNALFAGTAMVAGSARMLVAATGHATHLGGVAAALAARRPASAFESMATQILVIFMIRTAGPAWRAAPPHPALAATFGFALLPGALLGAILALVLLYLAAAEWLKRMYRTRLSGQ